MASIPLKPEYGPSLGRILAPRWRAASRTARAFVLVLCLALAALLLGAGLTLENAHYAHGGPAPFSFSYRDLYRAAPPPGAYVEVRRPRGGPLVDSFAVSPLPLPPYTGSPQAELLIYANAYIAALRRRLSDFRLLGEGKTRVNTVPGYDVLYTARVQARTMYGRDILLLPERHHPAAGVAIAMLSLPGAESQVTDPLLVGTTGVLELPIETFVIH
ncbi:MAG TPA: hypothetical protein VL972_05200 [Solirubrobacteraceae bacterium]|nr:hypothetical protein [Solirubrobacteraceae bacterium]